MELSDTQAKQVCGGNIAFQPANLQNGPEAKVPFAVAGGMDAREPEQVDSKKSYLVYTST